MTDATPAQPQSPVDKLKALWPGLLLTVVVGAAASFLADHRGGPAMFWALLFGMALNSAVKGGPTQPGIDFAARTVLRFGVALLGARITVAQLAGLGWLNGGLIVATVVATILFGVALARTIGLGSRIGTLTGVATAICGASAALAIAAVLPRDEKSERELVFTIAGITVLATVAMLFYPVLASLLALTPLETGLFLGGSLHDVAQVVGAGYAVSPEVGDAAVLTKMLRVAMLLPVVMAISVIVGRGAHEAGEGRPSLLPGFLIGFVVLAVIGSLGLIPPVAEEAMKEVSSYCLIVAIGAVGLRTSLGEIRTVGAKAMILMLAETVFLGLLVLAGIELGL